MINPFINLEDEITLRLSIRAAYKHEGFEGICHILGELAQSMQIVSEVALELMEEENKKNEGGK